MGAFLPGTLILANSDQGRALLASGYNAYASPIKPAPQLDTPTAGTAEGVATVLFPPLAVINGILSGIFGGVTQAPLTDVQSAIGKQFPNPDTTVCGTPIDISIVNAGKPATINIPCDDPQFGGPFRARDLDNLIVFYGLATFFQVMSKFISVGPSQNTSGGGGGGSEGPINISVNVDNSIPANVLRAVTNGINNGLDAGATQASKIAQDTTDKITSSLLSFTDQLGQSTKSIGDYIGSTLDNTLNNLFNPQSIFEQSINGSLSEIGGLVNSIQNEIVGPLGTQIEAINAAFGGIPASIEAIFQNLLKDLPSFLGPLIQILGPVGQQLAHIAEVLISHLPGVKGPVLWDDFGGLLAELAKAGAAIGGAAQTPDNVIYRPMDPLGPSCGSVEETSKNIDNWLGSNISIPCWAQEGIKFIRIVFVELLRLIPLVEQFYEQADELQNKSCQLRKLDPATMVRAWWRGIVDSGALNDELVVQGLSPARIKILSDLARYYYGPQEALDLFYRQVITPDQLNTLLQQVGMDADQIQAAKDGSFRLTSVEDAMSAWNRGLLTDEQLSQILGNNRLNTYQQDILKVLARRPPTVQEAMQGQLTRDAVQNFLLGSFTDVDTIPSWLDQFGRDNGLNESAVQSVWWAHWNIGGIGNWITSYYRGLRVYSELASVAKSLGIPETILTDLIESGRPLIPFRTIPSLRKAGIISDNDAKAELSKHGFDNKHIDWLLAYADRTANPVAATAASNVASLSVATARTLFDDGAITEDQYIAVLEAHKYTPDLAKAQAEADRLAYETKRRKQHIADLTAEVEASVITVDAALADLRANGFTDAEIARFEVSVRRATTKNVKHPTIAELDKFYKAALITQDQYRNELQLQGWADPWLTAFIGLIALPVTTTTSTGGS